MNLKDIKKLMSGQQERYHYLPQEVIAQHLGMKSLKWQFLISRQDVVVLVCQLQKSWLNLKAQRNTFVVTIATLQKVCRAIFKLERFGRVASFGDNK